MFCQRMAIGKSSPEEIGAPLTITLAKVTRCYTISGRWLG